MAFVRNMLTAVGRAFGAAPAQSKSYSGTPSYGMIPPLGSVPSAAGVLVSQATAMTVSAVYAAVDIRSTDVARCTPALYRETKDDQWEKIKDHPIARLLRRPNQVQTWFEFARQMWIAYLLRQNAYAAIIRDRRGNPIALIPINPDAVMVLEAADGSYFYNVNRIGLWQIAMLRDFPTAIPSEDVLHIRGITFNTLVGVSTIGLARDSIGLGMGLEQQASRFVGNGARPSGVLKAPKTLTEPAVKRLKQSWNDFCSGIQNVGTTAVLEDGVEWVQLQLSSVDLEFMAQRKWQVEDVSRYFRVPLRKLNVSLEKSALKPFEEQQAYVNDCVAPDLDHFEQALHRQLALPDDYKIDMDETRLLRADERTRFENHRIGMLTGFLTPNEVRRKEGLPPVEGGDELMHPANMAALGSDIGGNAPDGAGRPANGREPAPPVPNVAPTED